ncbi:TetR/AcrR family transcriptional regulator [Streptomyces roseolilacinus]|uniref:TetR family transcriptional regulator n=1 Tax=Streptomyces roseolilacinus TaxID=66904 RepID=A0A918EKD2_9ACTN|nr:TetR/AcrR family transcriptional regulator [Streptomyces roseolilacinus]GGQ13020.1 TetR family transcriptional regulator [Streptomyces roseolilacinus]
MDTAPDPTPLRDRLVQAGVELLEEGGAQALSLREIARRAGVSHGAPRRHFPTHLALLSAVARRGFTDLAAALPGTRAPEDPREARERLLELGRAYLRFAADHPGMYQLMFRHDLLESGHLGLRDTSLPLFDALVRLVAAARPDVHARRAAGALWANLHGIAQLWGWGSLPLACGTDEVEPLLRTALDAHLGAGR